MLRRVTLFAVALAAVLAPVVARASIVPDNTYGTSSMASISTDCAAGTLKLDRTAIGYGGEAFVLEECAAGYHRVLAVGDTGEPITSYGTNGHVTFQVPSSCRQEQPVLVPAKDGSLYAMFWRQSPPPGSDFISDLRVCIVRITAAGRLVQFGGSSPVRHLDRLGSDISYLTGGAVDSHDRLLVFTQRVSSIWQDAAAWVNRYTLTGSPDRSFSSDGQRAFTQPHQEGLQWGGVVGDKPVLAIRAYAPTATGAPLGTALVRFTAAGTLDDTFAGDGTLYLRSADLGGARLVGNAIVVDDHKRITYAAQQGDPDQDAMWTELRRIGPTGRSDTAFNATTTKVRAPAGTSIPEPHLWLSAGKYVLQWEYQPSTDPLRTTGFNGDGSRWTALGTNGTTNHPTDQFLPDRPGFYEIAYFAPGNGPEEVQLWRRLVQ